MLIAGASSSQATAPARVAGVAGSIARIPDPARLQLVSHGDLVRVRYGAVGAPARLRGFSSRDRLWIARSEFGAKPRSVRRNEPAHGPSADHGFPGGHLRSLPRGGGRGELVQRGARAVLEAGGPGTSPGNAALNQLDRALFEHRLSPGGSADLSQPRSFSMRLTVIKEVREDNSLNRGTNGKH